MIAFLRRCWAFSHCSIHAVVESSPNGDTPICSHPMQASTCNAGDPDLIPGSRRSPAEGNGNLLQYSCLENPMNKGTWRATGHEVTRVGHDSTTTTANSILCGIEQRMIFFHHINTLVYSYFFSSILSYKCVFWLTSFPGGSDGKEPAFSSGDLGLIPEFGRSPEEGNSYPLQYSCWRILWTEKPEGCRNLPGGPVVKTSSSNAGGTYSIPGQGTKIPHASRQKTQNIKQKQ